MPTYPDQIGAKTRARPAAKTEFSRTGPKTRRAQPIFSSLLGCGPKFVKIGTHQIGYPETCLAEYVERIISAPLANTGEAPRLRLTQVELQPSIE
jgi:hypothetical protein